MTLSSSQISASYSSHPFFSQYTNIYNGKSVGVGKIFNVFECSLLCLLRMYLFEQKCSKNSNL